MTAPNVLASRYASAELARLWSPEHKIVLERQLWIAVLKAQRDLGIETPDGVVEAYEAVVDQVDLDSIAAVEAALTAYDGALVVVSHDADFLTAIGVDRRIGLRPGG